MSMVLVTGPTGLIGSNICAELLRRGFEVKGLVRPESDAVALQDLGVEIARGDVATFSEVLQAADGCEFCVHTAALVAGGDEAPWSDFYATNIKGSLNVFDAARQTRMTRVISFASGPNPRATTYPLGASGGDPYFESKLQVALEILRRVETGQDIIEINPMATFGPAPSGARAATMPGFNARIILALQGQLSVVPNLAPPWNLASDTARTTVNALTRGRAGDRFDLGGPVDQIVDVVTLINTACEIQGGAMEDSGHDLRRISNGRGRGSLRSFLGTRSPIPPDVDRGRCLVITHGEGYQSF